MKPIYISCAHWIRTGGPEALHQLSDALLEQGFDARLVYFNEADVSGVGRADDGSIKQWLGVPKLFPEYACPFEEYAHYRANLARSIDCSEPCVIVLPETLAHMTPLFPPNVTVLIWWLSVDNGFGALAKINLNHLRKANVWHAAQSRYAAGVLEALQMRSAGMLSDYTIDLTQYATPLPMAERPKLALFNANHKVIADLDAIIAEIAVLDPEIECVKIAGQSSRQEMAELFARARVYVDLGNFPGKDRGPREARAMGCVPIVSESGAGRETCGWAIKHDWPKFIAGHVASPSDWALVKEPNERATFNTEVRDVFSKL